MEMASRRLILLFSFFSSMFLSHHPSAVATPAPAAALNNMTAVHVGVILDLQTLPGKRSRTSISMAVDDFYAAHANSTTRVVLHLRDSPQDVFSAAAAALDLLENVQTQAIIGPMTSAEAAFVADLGNKTHVPILSFSATSPSLSPARTPYFVRTTLNDSSQVGAIAAVVKSFRWRRVAAIYEDSDFGSGIIPSLVDGLRAISAQVPYRSVVPPFATDDQIAAELYKLMNMETRVFVVHMMPDLGSRLFSKAKEIGMMDSGYVWIMTDSISNVLNSLDPSVAIAMEGALGVRPYVPTSSEAVKNFTARWKARFRQDNQGFESTGPTIFEMWAYDTVWAVAMAVEKAGMANSSFVMPQGGAAAKSTGLAALSVSQAGPSLLGEILNARFQGLSGKFRLVDGQLQSPAFEIVNVIGKGARGIGFWTPAGGLSKQLNSAVAATGETSANSTTSANDLKTVIWPGDSPAVPKGWLVPTSGKVLKVGVPMKQGFNQFVDVKHDPITNTTSITGYCIDLFDAVMKTLPYAVPYEYAAVVDANGNAITDYNLVVNQVYLQKFDIVVGDTTIVANRTLYVDFTLPYTESGVSMVVPIKQNDSRTMWIFLKPLSTDLWLGTLAFFFFTGLVVWVIEHRVNPEFRGPPAQQLGIIFYFAFSTLVFAHKEKLESNLSRVLVIVWVFVVLILTSSYTASLTSMLTVQQLQPTVTDIYELRKNGDYVGYQDGSFVTGLLERMKFSPSMLKNYTTMEEYNNALSMGSSGGGVGAIFDEIPYLKLFLHEHPGEYTMVGPTYKTAGFGFVFPKGSPLLADVSWAVLNVTEGEKMTEIERKWFGDPMAYPSQDNSLSSSSLDFKSFGGLFLLTGLISVLALLVFLFMFVFKNWNELRSVTSGGSLLTTMASWARHYDNRDLTSHTFKRKESIYVPDDRSSLNGKAGIGPIVPKFDGTQTPVSIPESLDINFCPTAAPTSPSSDLCGPLALLPEGDASVELTEVTRPGE